MIYVTKNPMLENQRAPRETDRIEWNSQITCIVCASVFLQEGIEFLQQVEEHWPREHPKIGASIGVIGRKITTAPVFATGGKPSTWLPPGRLVEQACIIWYTYGIDAVVWRWRDHLRYRTVFAKSWKNIMKVHDHKITPGSSRCCLGVTKDVLKWS